MTASCSTWMDSWSRWEPTRKDLGSPLRVTCSSSGDKVSGGSQASAGRAERIRIYDGNLSPEQVADLFAGGEPPAP